MNEDQFLKIIASDDKQFWRYCRALTVKFGHIQALKQLMEFRRDLQKGLSRYSKGKGSMDGIQNRAVYIIEMISKWCGQYYKEWARSTTLRSMPEVAKNPRKLKNFVNNAWDQYVRKNSY